MDRKHKIEIIIASAIIIALIALVLWLLLKDRDQNQIIDDTTIEVVNDPVLSGVIQDQVFESADAVTVSRVFVERLGSFSNESGYENLNVIKAMATQSLQNRLDDIADDAKGDAGTAYYGISTVIITIKEESLSETQARFLITTQRQESIDSPSNTTIRYQDIVVDLIKIDDEWLVEDFEWK